MANRLRTVTGLILISGTIISISYVMARGANEQKKKTNSEEVNTLKAEIKSLTSDYKKLTEEKNSISSQFEDKTKQLNNAIGFINSKNNIDLKASYLVCLKNSQIPSANTITKAQYDNYIALLKRKVPIAKAYLEENVRGDKLRSVAMYDINPTSVNLINFSLYEVYASEIYPECKTTVNDYKKYKLDVKKQIFTEITQ